MLAKDVCSTTLSLTVLSVAWSLFLSRMLSKIEPFLVFAFPFQMLTAIVISRWIELFKEATQKGADGQWSKSLNMADEVNYLVFDILGDLCFGKNFNMKEPESDLKHVPELMATYLQILHPVSTADVSSENTLLIHTNVGGRSTK